MGVTAQDHSIVLASDVVSQPLPREWIVGTVPPGTQVSGQVAIIHGDPQAQLASEVMYIVDAGQPGQPGACGRRDELHAKIRSLSVSGTTLCPVSAPALFDATQFLAGIINVKEQAIQRGWIKHQGVGISLDAKLNAAQAALTRGNTRTAANVLDASSVRSMLRLASNSLQRRSPF